MRRVASLILLSAVLLAVSACTSSHDYVNKGNKLFAQGRYQEAILNYRKAIQKDPGFGEAYYRLGLAADAANDSVQAYAALRRAAELLPSATDVKEKLADLVLVSYANDPSHPQGEYVQLTRLSGDLLKANPRSFEGLRVKGYLALSDRKYDEAIGLFRQAQQVNPSDASIGHAVSETLLRSGHPQESEKAALEVIAKQKTYGPIYDELFNLYLSQNRTADAQKILETKVNNNPTQSAFILQLARYYADRNKPTEMNAALQKLLSRPSDFAQARLDVGDFYSAIHNYEESKRYYYEAAKASPASRLTADKRIIRVLNAERRLQDALQLADATVKNYPRDLEASSLRAGLWLETGKPEDLTRAVQVFQDLSAKNASDATLHFQLGRAQLASGDFNSASAQFAEVVKLRPGFVEARYELAQISLRQHRPTQALEQASAILALRPADMRAGVLHAAAQLAAGNRDGATKESNALVRRFPNAPEPKMLLAEVASTEGKFGDAEEILRKTGVDDPRVSLGLAQTYARQQQAGKAVEVLSEALKKNPNSVELHQNLASIAASSGQYDLAIREFQELLRSNPKSTLLYLRLGEMYAAKNDDAQAIATYRKARELSPGDEAPTVVLAQALAADGQPEAAIAEYRKFLSSHPDSPNALNNLAFLLCDTGRSLDEALKLAQRARQAAPKDALFADTVGYVYLKKGMLDTARRTFETLVRNYPTSSTFHYHLGMALFEMGDKEGARRELDHALAQHPGSSEESQIRKLAAKIG